MGTEEEMSSPVQRYGSLWSSSLIPIAKIRHKLNKGENHTWNQNYLKKCYFIYYIFIFALLKSHNSLSLVSKVLNASKFQHRYHLPERLNPVKPQNTEMVPFTYSWEL